MEKFEAFPRHKKIIKKAIELLSADERVIGLYLAGSFVWGNPDIYSDIDLNILVPADQRETIVKEHDTLIHEVGCVKVAFPAIHRGDPNQIIVFYDADGLPIHVDYEYRILDDLVPSHRSRAIRIILDRDGSLTRWHAASQAAPPPSPPISDDLQYFEDRFWGWIWYTASKIERGECWEAWDAINDIRKLVLLTLAYWVTGTRAEGYRRVEIKFPPDILGILAQSIPSGTDQHALRQALNGLTDGYIHLMEQVLSTFPALHIHPIDRAYFLNAIRRCSSGSE